VDESHVGSKIPRRPSAEKKRDESLLSSDPLRNPRGIPYFLYDAVADDGGQDGRHQVGADRDGVMSRSIQAEEVIFMKKELNLGSGRPII
jgi:hypothetical protein